MCKIRLILFLSIFLCLIRLQVQAQEVTQKIPPKTNILFLLDGSGSMLAPWENSNRIKIAKKLLSETVDSLKVNPKVNIALRVYGHQRHRKFKDCKDSKLEVTFGSNNHQIIKQKLYGVTPKGTTPLAYSLEEAAKDFPNDKNARNILIIITDGIESCGGDPCAVSKALQSKRVFLKPFVIGLGMKANIGSYFDCLGKFYDTRNILGFRKVLNRALKRSLDETTVSVELLDYLKRKTITNVNVTFQNVVTEKPEYEFIHFRDQNGKPDSVKVDGVIPYHLIVNTLPPIKRSNIEIKPGEHNVFSINAANAPVQFKMQGLSEYTHDLSAFFESTNNKNWGHIQPFKKKQNYLLGTYNVMINTLPPTFRKVNVKPNQINEVVLPGPGIVNMRSSTKGYGSLYQVNKKGVEKWIKDFTITSNRYTFALQPGRYNLVFRAENALGSKYTSIKKIKIKTGETLNLNVF